MRLTPKQEKFAQVYVKVGNASEAYRQAYNAGKMNPNSVKRKAFDVLENVNVAATIKSIRDKLAEKAQIGLDDLLEELEEARQAALTAESPQSSAAVNATMGKAKLLGLDKQIIDHTSSDRSMSPKSAIDVTKLSDAALAELMNAKTDNNE